MTSKYCKHQKFPFLWNFYLIEWIVSNWTYIGSVKEVDVAFLFKLKRMTFHWSDLNFYVKIFANKNQKSSRASVQLWSKSITQHLLENKLLLVWSIYDVLEKLSNNNLLNLTSLLHTSFDLKLGLSTRRRSNLHISKRVIAFCGWLMWMNTFYTFLCWHFGSSFQHCVRVTIGGTWIIAAIRYVDDLSIFNIQ